MLEFRLQKIRYFIAESDLLQKSNKVLLLDLIYMDGFKILILQKKKLCRFAPEYKTITCNKNL